MIRPYVPTDLPALLDLLEATFAPFFAESMPAYVGVEVTALQHPDWRGGVARSLCEHGIAHLREAGVALITIGTGGDGFHAPARALYESLGFRGLPTMFYARTY